MSYKSLINSNVKKAFSMLGDLAPLVEITQKVNPDFDFGSKTVTGDAPLVVSIKAIKVEAFNKGTLNVTFNVMASDLPEPSLYDKIKDKDNRVWTIVHPISSDGFITVLNVVGG